MYVSAVVVAAGIGRRMQKNYRGGIIKISEKLLARIGSKPVILHSLSVLAAHPAVSELIIVVNKKNRQAISRIAQRLNIKKDKKIVLGGLRRQDSVLNGLRQVQENSKLVLIHDAARPFIDNNLINRLIKAARKKGAAIAAVPVKDTIKSVCAGNVTETLDRQRLWQVQTPQIFKKEILLMAYKRFGRTKVTDDASLVERAGSRVCVVMGSYSNIKITTPQDLAFAKAIASTNR